MVLGGAAAVAAVAAVAVAAGKRRSAAKRSSAVVACQASPADELKKVAVGAAAAVVVAGSMADSASAYPIFAQQNYKNPEAPTGRIVCANCHLAMKPLIVSQPHTVLPDTIFKINIDVTGRYEKRRQLAPDGSQAELNVGAIAVMPTGWRIAPRDRLPKVIKKEMKGLSWSPYSKEMPNIAVVGPVPGVKYHAMILPILAPIPDGKEVYFDSYEFNFAGNRGRGQVYPEGNLSNNNVFNAAEAGTVQSIVEKAEDAKIRIITIARADGTTFAKEVLAGAVVIVKEGQVVAKDQQLTTNPNVGGYGQETKSVTLQDVNRVYAVQALMGSIFIAQLTFVLKKKQFEKVQLAEGF
jgi:apocytochrome f